MSERDSAYGLSLALHAAGLIGFYSGYGLLQERIMKGSYGPEETHFGSSSLLVLLNRLFAMCLGVAILAYKSRAPDAPTFTSRLTPRSPLYAYAAVAVCNFLSTTCQYEALKFVSFTTQSLAKTAKMVPVLLVGTLVYQKSHSVKQWVSAAVVTLGCACYLFSNAPATKHAHQAAAPEGEAWTGLTGAALLMGYLFFDGLTSTTQERVFGKSPSSSDPFGPKSPVLDQMLYVNLFAVLISAAVSAAASMSSSSLRSDMALLLSSPALVIDVCMLSLTAALGLIVLLNTIACFGALTSSTIMTCRQFLSILINAGAFGNFASVGGQGWLGVGWVASGIFIKMDPRFRDPKAIANPPTPAASSSPLVDGQRSDSFANDEKSAIAGKSLSPLPEYDSRPASPASPASPLGSPALGGPDSPFLGRRTKKARYTLLFKQYGVPLLVPAMVALCISTFIAPSPTTSLDRLPSFDPLKPHLPFSAQPSAVAAATIDPEVADGYESTVEAAEYNDDQMDTDEPYLQTDGDTGEAAEKRSVKEPVRMMRRRRRHT